MECNCPKINEKKFDKKMTSWKGRCFYTLPLNLIFHIPLKIGKKITKAMMSAESSGYETKDVIMQQDGLFKGKIMIEIKEPKVDDKRIIKFGDTKFYSVASTEPRKKLGKAVSQAMKDLKKKRLKVKNKYLWYLTCPECSEKRGYKTVIFFELKEEKKPEKKKVKK